MDERQRVAWLHRRAGFGLHPDQVEPALLRGATAELAALVATIPTPDPWADLVLEPDAAGRRTVIAAWTRHLIGTDTPFQDRRTWMLHGWLVSSMAKVTRPDLMVEQIRLLMRDGGGSFPGLLREITVDPAMLVYLDGRTSTAAAPNENYGRELLELFSLGVGNYTEADVQAAARALTGWIVGRDVGEPRLVPSRHDAAPQTLLGVGGVHDVDSVVDAISGDPAHAAFVARRVVREFLGDDLQLRDAVDELGRTYVDAGMRLDPVIIRALELGLEGATTPLVLAPVPWLVIATRVTGTDAAAIAPRLGRAVARGLVDMGQIPLVPPNVGGWPGGTAWFTTSSLIARTNVAAAVASLTPPGQPVRVAIEEDDLDRAAELLGLPEPFSSATRAAVRGATDPIDRLTLALVSPENLLS